MDFNNILMELEMATEAVSGEMKAQYNEAAKSASTAIRAARKAMKAGNYDEAKKLCDEAIANINAFKTRLAAGDEERGEERGEEGENKESKATKGFGAAKVIVKAVLGALAAVAVVVTATKQGAKMANAKYDKAQKAENRVRLTADSVYQTSSTDLTKGKTKEDRMKELKEDTDKAYGKAVRANTAERTANTKTGKGAAAIVGAGIVTALSAFLTNKKYSEDSIVKAMDASIKSLEAIKAACDSARREANEAFSDVEEFYTGIFEAIFEGEEASESFVVDLVRVGMDDLMACEMYVDFIVPNM